MRQLRVLKNAVKAICRNPTRTFLTTLGIVIGIASVIALMEVGAGAQIALQKSVSSMGINTIRIWPGTVIRGGVSAGSGARANITMKDVDAIIKNCENIVRVSPVVSVRGQIIYGGKNWSPYSINGVNADYLDISGWQIEEGSAFSKRQVDRGAKVCLIGSTIVRELFDGENPIGKGLRIQNVVFKIIGVLKTKGANMMGMDQDDCVLAPWTAVKMRLKGAGSSSISAASASSTTITTGTRSASTTYTDGVSLYAPVSNNNMPPVRFANVDSLIVEAASQDVLQDAVKEVALTLRESHRLSDDQNDDFNLRTMAEFTNIFTSQTKTTTNLLLCVAFVSLVVGGVGIMNIMLVSVTERTREIGLRMAVGARGKDILRQFLIESIVICLFGGIIGILVGHGTSMVLSNFMGWPVSLSYTAIILSVGVSALVGVVFGYYPAWKAARLDPIEALRYE